MDIYIRSQRIEKSSGNDIETDDNLELFLQEIEMLLNTQPTSVLGEPDYGVPLIEFLFQFGDNSQYLVGHIRKQIDTYCLQRVFFEYTVDVQQFSGEVDYSMIIDVVVDDSKGIRIII